MKRRILLVIDKDQFQEYDYSLFGYKTAMDALGGNSGNAVFQYSLQSMLMDKTVEIDICQDLFKMVPHDNAYFDQINNNYDCVVYSPANIIAEYAKGRALFVAKNVYEKINIPIYLVGLGAQSDKYYSLDFMNFIRDDVYNTFRILLNKGGRIAVRGYFTAECLRNAGFSERDFVVTGCPSLFMKGPKLQVEKRNIPREKFNLSLNGFRIWNHPLSDRIFDEYPSSIFVDQEEFYRLLYMPNDLTWKEFQYLSDEKQKWFRMYTEGRIKLYCNFQSWYTDLIARNITFSYGCRIHGNVVPILAGIPAYIDTFDSRVKELAEYFDIPCGDDGDVIPDLYELYQSIDYSKFNKNFKEKYNKFAKFMEECSLPHNTAHITEMDAPVISAKSMEKIRQQMEAIIVKNIALNKKIGGKKIAFVAHEYGLYANHGGIASYLYQMTKGILQFYPDMEVHVLAGAYDSLCDLNSNPQFHLHPLEMNDYSVMSQQVLDILKDIRPDYVEASEYGALCLKSIIYRYEIGGELKSTKFFVNNHSATRECYEWSVEIPLEKADPSLMVTSIRENAQMLLADECIAPSDFMGQYVSKKYGLNHVTTLRHPTNLDMVLHIQLRNDVNKSIDLSVFNGKFVISCISRFEGRKRQKEIIKAFIKASERADWDAVLVLAGNSSDNLFTGEEYREECFKEIPKEYSDKIMFFDFAGPGFKRQIYAASNLGVMASMYENFPVAMTEYVYNGVPILVSKYNGSADYMTDTLDYTVFDPKDTESLTDKMIAFYKMGKKNWDDIAAMQFQALRFMTNPERAIYKKLLHFYNSPYTEIKGDTDILILDSKTLNSRIEDESIYNLVVILDTDFGVEIHNLINSYNPALQRHRPSEKIYFFEKLIYPKLSDMLENSRGFYLPGFKTEKEKIGVIWNDAIIDELIKRQSDMVVIQSLDSPDLKAKKNDFKSNFIRQFEYLNSKLKIADLYEEET